MGDLGTKLIRSVHATKKEGSFGTFNTMLSSSRALYYYFLKRIESLECNYVPELKNTFL